MIIDRFGALADPTRRQILAALVRSGTAGRTAGQLSRDLGRGRPLVSYHLAQLVAAGLAGVAADPADRRRRIYRAAARPGGGSRSRRQGVEGGPATHPHLRALVPPADARSGLLPHRSPGAARSR